MLKRFPLASRSASFFLFSATVYLLCIGWYRLLTGSKVLVSILVGVSRYSFGDAAPSRLLWTILLYVGGRSSFDPILAWSFLQLVLVRRVLVHRRLERAFGL